MNQSDGGLIKAREKADDPSRLLGYLPFLLIILAFAADRLTKNWAAGYLAEYGTTRVNALITLIPTYNRGIAFGLFQGIGPAVGWLSVLIVSGLIIYMIRTPRSMPTLRSGLALIAGGSLGNLVDRLSAGQVLDFIQSPLRPGVFNVADVMIYLGLLLTIVAVVRNKPTPALSPAADASTSPDEHDQDEKSGRQPGDDPQKRIPIHIE